MPAKKLSVVPPDTKAAAPPTGVYESANYSERALLVALRTRIAKDIDAGVPPAYLAPLARQVRDIDREIRALDARVEQEAAESGDVPDEAFDASAI